MRQCEPNIWANWSNGGLKLIVIDPRRTESAQKAVLHLAVRPGEDPTLLAGIVRIIIEEGCTTQRS